MTVPKGPSKAAGRKPKVLAPRALVPFAHVVDVTRSVTFYETLGFTVGGKLAGEDGTLNWVILEHEGAQLMVGRATAPVIAEEQAVLFYVYYQDVAAAHEMLIQAGVDVGPIEFPRHSPRGEFRVVDPDGYSVQVTHT